MRTAQGIGAVSGGIAEAAIWAPTIMIAAVLQRMALRRGLLGAAPLVGVWYPSATIVLLVGSVMMLNPFSLASAIPPVALMAIQAITAVRSARLLVGPRAQRPAS